MRLAAAPTTDWDQYYKAVPAIAQLTRRYTRSTLISVMRQYEANQKRVETIVEFGGANSCFLGAILKEFRPSVYHVVDRNQFGLSLLDQRVRGRADVVLHQCDILQLPELGVKADVVFSVGLIEHFDAAHTSRAIQAHFEPLRAGGYAVISYPTPTWIYLAARVSLEACGLWKFPDERPLRRDEVISALRGRGEIVFEKTLWPLILTQHLVVVRKGFSGLT